jgi:hypothetical protein
MLKYNILYYSLSKSRDSSLSLVARLWAGKLRLRFSISWKGRDVSFSSVLRPVVRPTQPLVPFVLEISSWNRIDGLEADYQGFECVQPHFHPPPIYFLIRDTYLRRGTLLAWSLPFTVWSHCNSSHYLSFQPLNFQNAVSENTFCIDTHHGCYQSPHLYRDCWQAWWIFIGVIRVIRVIRIIRVTP